MNQQQPMPQEEVVVFKLASAGFLPPPSCTTPSGGAAWDASGLAKLFDLSRDEFLAMMKSRGPAYREDRGIPSTWPMLVEGS
jgi:hypothetical protein